MPLKAYFSPAAFDLLDSVIIFMCVSVYGFVKKWRDYKSPRRKKKKKNTSHPKCMVGLWS